MKKQNTISAHVIQFCRFLRFNKFNLGPLEEMQALEALQVIPYTSAAYFKNALKSTLVKNKSQLDRFDDLYLQYWSEVKDAENAKQKQVEEEKQKPEQAKKAPPIHVLRKWLNGNREEEEIEMASYSAEQVFTEQDFSTFSQEDLSQALRYTNLLVKKLSNKKGRRNIPTKRYVDVDLRKIIRKNINSEEIINLSFKKKKIEKLRLVLICDVSRSMELYSRFLIQFMYGLNQASTNMETFVFSTRLERITKSLKNHDFSTVLEDVKNSFDQWSGGTKIGSSLLDFSTNYGAQLLDQKTKVIILSDGWDTDEPDLVAEAMSRIKRKCSKIIWLNPLASNPNFTPEVACLQAAMPYIDIFQAANTIESLEKLVRTL